MTALSLWVFVSRRLRAPVHGQHDPVNDASCRGHVVDAKRARQPRCSGCCPVRWPAGSTPSWRQPRTQTRVTVRRPRDRSTAHRRRSRCPASAARHHLPRQEGLLYRTVLEPYGVVALRGRWYATGLDSRSGQVRSFRLDRVAHAVVQEGQFSVPGGFDPAAQVVEAVSGRVVPARGLGAGPGQRAGGTDADARIIRHHRADRRGTRGMFCLSWALIASCSAAQRADR